MNLDGARILLAPAVLATRLRLHPALNGRVPREVQFDSLWVKPGRHFNVCYRLTFETAPRELRCAAFALEPGRAERIATGAADCAHADDEPGCAGCASYVAQPGLLLQIFPYDYRLPTLPDCLDARRIGAALDLPDCRRCEPAGYRPGMRCQIRYELADGSVVFGKVAVEEEPGRAAGVQARIAAAHGARPRGFGIARPLGYCSELRLSAVSAVAGRSLYEALRTGDCVQDGIRPIAHALAEFHELEVAGISRSYAPEDESRLLAGWVALVAHLYPDLAPALRGGLALLQECRPAAQPPRALVHRDFYDKQILLDGEAVNLLDMDTACRGDPEIDLGNFAAQLRLRGLQWGRSQACAELEAGFLAAYPRPIDRIRLDWYRRATLLRLACGYAVRPHWHHLAPALCAAMSRA